MYTAKYRANTADCIRSKSLEALASVNVVGAVHSYVRRSHTDHVRMQR